MYMKKSMHVKYLVAVIIVFGIFTIFSRSTPDSNTALTLDARLAFMQEFYGVYIAESPAAVGLREYSMEAAESEVEIIDGYRTNVWSYNGTVPGPEIRLKFGETLRLNFTNNLPQETTVHFHGVRVPNAMDGVPGVTQEAIKSGESFVYEFTPKDAGTFWFHPHVRSSEQLERGLYGVLIVEDTEPLPYSQDVVWVVDDWRFDATAQISEPFNQMRDVTHNGRWGNILTVNGQTDEKLVVRPGERIRLRLVNTSNARVYNLDFGKLNAQVVAVDGLYVRKTFNPKEFDFSPGNRLDVDIIIPVDSAQQMYTVSDLFTDDVISLGSIVVYGDTVDTPEFTYPENSDVPMWSVPPEVRPDKEYVFDGGMGSMMMGSGGVWSINGKAYPQYDPLTLKKDEFTMLQLVNKSFGLHPMHLHGQFFKVIAKNGERVDEGFFRDTVLVHPEETVDIALVPMDVGTWAFHCHVLEHAETGMMTAITVE